MRRSQKIGVSFGLTSGIVTTLGLMVGLNSSTHSKMVVAGGIITIAVADALSDAFGIHISQEAQNSYSHKQVWEATIYTFLAKFFFAISFLVPLLIFELSTAIIVGVIWGLLFLGGYSYYMAKKERENPVYVVSEHLIITVVVIVITHYLGRMISYFFS